MELGDIAFARSGLALGDVFCNRCIQLCDLTFDQGQARSGLPLQNGVGLYLAAIAQARALLDQTRPGHLQVSEIKELFRNWCIRFQGQGRPHPGQAARGSGEKSTSRSTRSCW